MRELAPAWPPNARLSITSTDRPSEAAYTAVASPAGPAPTTATSNVAFASGRSFMPRQRPSSLSLGLRSTMPLGHATSGSSAAVAAAETTHAFASSSVSGSNTV